MSPLRTTLLLAAASLLPTFVAAQDVRGEPSIRPILLRDGFRSICKRGDLSKLAETRQAKVAASAGVDLERPDNPILLTSFRDGRLYLLFYKAFEHAFADRPYVIQRIRKTERTWKEKGAKPTERVTYQVEVFKLLGGETKRPDQHFGRYSLRGNYRREIVKEYEIGFGVVPDKCEGTDWPFDARKLFVYLQEYDEDRALYDAVKFVEPLKWSLHVSFSQDGKWRVRSRELGFDAPKKMPKLRACAPSPLRKSKTVVLVGDQGPEGFTSLAESGGEELVRTKFVNDNSAVTTDKGLLFNLDAGGDPYRVATVAGFLGQTDKGLRHGDTRARVVEVMGAPTNQPKDAWMWRYRGVQFRFDGMDRVDRIWVDVK